VISPPYIVFTGFSIGAGIVCGLAPKPRGRFIFDDMIYR